MAAAPRTADVPHGAAAIVTGASRRIGAATARALPHASAAVALSARTETELALIAAGAAVNLARRTQTSRRPVNHTQ